MNVPRPVAILDLDEFEEVELPNNVVSLLNSGESPNSAEVRIVEQRALTFEEIFKLLVLGEEVQLKVPLKAEYNSLRSSLCRRYKSYQEIKMVLNSDEDNYLQCDCKRMNPEVGASYYSVRFRLRPSTERRNASTKKYEIFKDL